MPVFPSSRSLKKWLFKIRSIIAVNNNSWIGCNWFGGTLDSNFKTNQLDTFKYLAKIVTVFTELSPGDKVWLSIFLEDTEERKRRRKNWYHRGKNKTKEKKNWKSCHERRTTWSLASVGARVSYVELAVKRVADFLLLKSVSRIPTTSYYSTN